MLKLTLFLLYITLNKSHQWLWKILWLKLFVNRCIRTSAEEKYNKFHYIDKKQKQVIKYFIDVQLNLNLLNCTFLKMCRVLYIIWDRVLNSVAQLCVGVWWWCFYWWHIACPYSLMWSMWQQNPINEVYNIKHSPPMSFKIGSNKAVEYCYYTTQLWVMTLSMPNNKPSWSQHV